jgi:2-keto-4-pentenoate hydratase/2-oxohepta-3-ene-1,7-dioic acid hydratase in catechol pathway
MKFVSFARCGQAGFGAIAGDGIVDLTGRLGPGIVTLRHAIAAGAVAAAARHVEGRAAEFSLSDVALLPVVPDPGKILCIGLNYETHRAETRRPEAGHPTIFTRYADTQVGHRQALVKPKVSDRFDYEGELAIVIGRGGRRIDEARAMDHVAGYACYNDASVRDWQRHTHQFTPGKNFPGTGAFGPFLVTPDEVGDHTRLPITTRLNGEVMQQASLADLIFPIPRLIAYCSAFTPLGAGDVIVTGTPGGVGDRRDPPVYMKPGDVVSVDIGAVGTLVNPVVEEE